MGKGRERRGGRVIRDEGRDRHDIFDFVLKRKYPCRLIIQSSARWAGRNRLRRRKRRQRHGGGVDDDAASNVAESRRGRTPSLASDEPRRPPWGHPSPCGRLEGRAHGRRGMQSAVSFPAAVLKCWWATSGLRAESSVLGALAPLRLFESPRSTRRQSRKDLGLRRRPSAAFESRPLCSPSPLSLFSFAPFP